MPRQKPPAERALSLLNDVLEHELTDDQAIELAKAYALAQIAQGVSGATEALTNFSVALMNVTDTLSPLLDSLAAERITKHAQTLASLAEAAVAVAGDVPAEQTTTEGTEE